MPDKKGDTEITIPTYRGMELSHNKDQTTITIYSLNGKIKIKCRHFHWDDPDEKN
jgi:hypothetical protein